VSKVVVAAIGVLIAVAAADAVRQSVGRGPSPEARRPEARLTSWRIDRGPPPCRSLVRSLVRDACGRYVVIGGAVRRSGEPFLGARSLAGAFPRSPHGRVEAVRVSDGHGDLLAVAVRDLAGQGAIEVWHDGGAVAGAFPLAPAAFAGGLGFSPGGHLVAAYDARGRATLYDLRGNEVAVAGERRPG
jgi:hypothetical protein